MFFLIPVHAGDWHSREMRLFDQGRSDQLVYFNGNHHIQGNSEELGPKSLLCFWHILKGWDGRICQIVTNENFIGSSFQVKTPIVNAKSKVLVPGLPGHQAPVKGATRGQEKRKSGTDAEEVGWIIYVII